MIQLLIFLNFFDQKDCRSVYLDKIFESQNLSKYYIVVNVKVNEKEGEIVVLNKNLYNSLKRKDRKFANTDKYKEFTKDKILHTNPISLTKMEMYKMNTKFIDPDSSVFDWSATGEEKFIEHYFHVYKEHNYASLRNEVDAHSIQNIVKVLFNWNYLMTSIEGNLIIEQLNFCKNSY